MVPSISYSTLLRVYYQIGCFHAYCLFVFDFLLPSSLQSGLRPYRSIWAVSLLTHSTSLLLLDWMRFFPEFLHSLSPSRTLLHAFSETSLYLFVFRTRTTLIAFVENQLSRRLISLSPLPTSHPKSLQRLPVQSSMPCYWHFNLLMGSSLRFGSLICGSLDLSSFSLSLLSFTLSPHHYNSLTHYTIST